jgi:hypothetical protein
MKFIALLFFFTASAFSIEPMDDYYADDLLDAVDQAKSSPHHYDYSNHYRYKRTTAQSIELNRLNLKELDATRLKAKNNKQKEGNLEIVLVDNLTTAKQESNIKTNVSDDSINSPTLSIPSQQYISNQGRLSSIGVSDRSTIRSTARP